MADPVRRAGSGQFVDGTDVIWSVADGRKGRRWREVRSKAGVVVSSLLLETFPEGAVENPVFEIVGVISDAKNQGIQNPPRPEAFVPYTLTGAFERGILVRTHGDPGAMLQSVRREIWAVDRGVAVTMTGTLSNFLAQFSYAEPRFSAVLLGVFAGVGLILVAIGVYSVIAYSVSRQTHEIGIRMALGASRGIVLRMIAWTGLRLIAAGLAIGLLGTFLVSRVVSSQLWGVSPHDPLTLSLVVAVLMVCGLTACWVPALRATRVEPVRALRLE